MIIYSKYQEEEIDTFIKRVKNRLMGLPNDIKFQTDLTSKNEETINLVTNKLNWLKEHSPESKIITTMEMFLSHKPQYDSNCNKKLDIDQSKLISLYEEFMRQPMEDTKEMSNITNNLPEPIVEINSDLKERVMETMMNSQKFRVTHKLIGELSQKVFLINTACSGEFGFP